MRFLDPLVMVLGLVLLAIAGTITVLLARRRSPDQPRSRASRLGCIVLVVLGLAIVGLAIRHMQQPTQLLADPPMRFIAHDADIFFGDRFVGREWVEWVEPPPEQQPFPPNTSPRELLARLHPGAEILAFDDSFSVNAFVLDLRVEVTFVEAVLRHADGRLDPLRVILTSRSPVDTNPSPPPETYLVVRARAGERRWLGVVGAHSDLGEHSARNYLMRLEPPPHFQFECELLPTMPPYDEGSPTFYVDGLTASPAKDASEDGPR